MLDDRREVLRKSDARDAHRVVAEATARRGPRDHVARHGGDEQRDAVGALVQRSHEVLVTGRGTRTLGNVRGDLRFGERIQHDLLAEVMQAQLVPQRVERMVGSDDLGQPEARQPHETTAAASSRDVVDELGRRAIAPMQVLGDQQQRPVLGVAVEELAHLAQHALRIHADELSAQALPLFSSTEPGQLQQPGRRDGAQQRYDLGRRCGKAHRALPARASTARRSRKALRNVRART